MEPITLGAGLTSGGAGVALSWFLLKSKLESIKALWEEFNDFKEKVAEHRLSDAKEYATRSEVKEGYEKLERYMENRFTHLESLLRKK